MTFQEIEELFIEAASIDRRLPIQVRPAQVKSLSLPFVHSFEDRLGWEPADMSAGEIIRDSRGRVLSVAMRKKLKKVLDDKLEFGDKGRRAIEAELFWQNTRITAEEVAIWERANELIRVVGNEGQRRALMHWAIGKAGGRPFANWCKRDEGISSALGLWRKNRAAEMIFLDVSCVGDASTHENAISATLPKRGEIGDIEVNIAEPRHWMAEGSKPLICDFDTGLKEYRWAEAENERRRQREAKRKREAA